jgi:hypothetical protein
MVISSIVHQPRAARVRRARQAKQCGMLRGCGVYAMRRTGGSVKKAKLRSANAVTSHCELKQEVSAMLIINATRAHVRHAINQHGSETTDATNGSTRRAGGPTEWQGSSQPACKHTHADELDVVGVKGTPAPLSPRVVGAGSNEIRRCFRLA